MALCSLSNSTGTVPQIASAIRVKFGEDNLPTQLDKRVRETLGANASFTLTAGMSSWKLPEEWREHALSGFSSRYGMVEEVSGLTFDLEILSSLVLIHRIVSTAGATAPPPKPT